MGILDSVTAVAGSNKTEARQRQEGGGDKVCVDLWEGHKRILELTETDSAELQQTNVGLPLLLVLVLFSYILITRFNSMPFGFEFLCNFVEWDWSSILYNNQTTPV